jgi:hypothetical protein
MQAAQIISGARHFLHCAHKWGLKIMNFMHTAYPFSNGSTDFTCFLRCYRPQLICIFCCFTGHFRGCGREHRPALKNKYLLSKQISTQKKLLTEAIEPIAVPKSSWDWLRGGGSIVYPNPAYFPP